MPFFPKDRGHRSFEILESRRLLSVSVSSGYQDDTESIQSAINSAQPGGTVQLAGGTFHVSQTLNLDGRAIAGVPGQTVLRWTGGDSYLAASGSNSSLTGVTFSGAGLQISDNSQNVAISDDVFENISGFDSYHDNGISGFGGSNNLNITDNSFAQIGGNGAYLFTLNQSHFDNNTFTSCFEGVHAVNFDPTNSGQNCTFDHNTMTGISRHGIEIQNQWDNLSVGWNNISDFNPQPGGNSHIALSIATGYNPGQVQAQNVDVHDNILLGTGPGVPSNPNYCFTAIEIMGSGSIVNHNYIANWGWGVLDGETNNWQVTNNEFAGVTSQGGKDYENEYQGTSPSVDSGNSWSNSWDGSVPSGFSSSGGSSSGSSGDASSPAPTAGAPTRSGPSAPTKTKTKGTSAPSTGASQAPSAPPGAARQTLLGMR